MTEHFDRAIDAGLDASLDLSKNSGGRALRTYDFHVANYRAFTAALLEGLGPPADVGHCNVPDWRKSYDEGFLAGFNVCLAAIRERAGLGGNDADKA